METSLPMRALLMLPLLALAFAACGDKPAPDDSAPVKSLGKAELEKPVVAEAQPDAPKLDAGVAARMAMAIEKTKDAFDRAELYHKAKSLGAAGKALIPVLQKGLSDAEGVARAAAVEALAAIDATIGAAAASKALSDKDPEVRMRALAALDSLPAMDIESIIAFVRDEIDSTVQLAGVLVLEKKLTAAQGERVCFILGALDPKALVPCVRMVRKFALKAAVPKLATLVNCHDEDARVAVAEALAELGVPDKDALKGLVRALTDEALPVRKAAYAALKKLSGKDIRYNPEADEMELEDAQSAWKEAVLGK